MVYASIQLSWLRYFKIWHKGVFCAPYRKLHILVTLFWPEVIFRLFSFIKYLYEVAMDSPIPQLNAEALRLAGSAHFQCVIASSMLYFSALQNEARERSSFSYYAPMSSLRRFVWQLSGRSTASSCLSFLSHRLPPNCIQRCTNSGSHLQTIQFGR